MPKSLSQLSDKAEERVPDSPQPIFFAHPVVQTWSAMHVSLVPPGSLFGLFACNQPSLPVNSTIILSATCGFSRSTEEPGERQTSVPTAQELGLSTMPSEH